MEFNKKKKFDGASINGDGLENPHRTYDRIIYNNMILEYEQCYWGHNTGKSLYIKSQNGCSIISLINSDFKNRKTFFCEMLNFIKLNRYRNSKFWNKKDDDGCIRKITDYKFFETSFLFFYKRKEDGFRYFYKKNSLGMFGIQPGMEKYDKELYKKEEETYIPTNIDTYVFEAISPGPRFPGGSGKLEQYLNSKSKAFVYKYGTIPQKVVVSFIVERNGELSNIQILYTTDINYNNEIIKMIEKMPKWIPGKYHGVSARVKYVLTIPYC